jgi:[ribosomal protein S5]-alanine N-acetyltransferase
MSQPSLTTERLLLRPFVRADASALYRVLRDPALHRYFPRTDPPSRVGVALLISRQLAHWQEHGCGWWAVLDRVRQELIGWCGLEYLPEFGETEVAYLLSQAHSGRGLATEAARAAVTFGFDTLKLPRIIAITHVANAASQRVVAKLGMTLLEELTLWGIPCYRYCLEEAGFRSLTAAGANSIMQS